MSQGPEGMARLLTPGANTTPGPAVRQGLQRLLAVKRLAKVFVQDRDGFLFEL